MSNNEPPKPPDGSDHPGLVQRQPSSGIKDAIPTEAEGDALFDELFGELQGGDAMEEEDDDAATMMVDRADFEGLMGDAADDDDGDEDFDTHRPPAPDPGTTPFMPEHTLPIQPAPTLGEALVAQASDDVDDAADTGQHVAIAEEDLIDTNQYPKAQLPPELQRELEPLPQPPPPRPQATTDEIGFDEAMVVGDDAVVSEDDIASEDDLASQDDIASEDDIAFEDALEAPLFDDAVVGDEGGVPTPTAAHTVGEEVADPSSVNFADAIRPDVDPLGAVDSVAEEEVASYRPSGSEQPPEQAHATPQAEEVAFSEVFDDADVDDVVIGDDVVEYVDDVEDVDDLAEAEAVEAAFPVPDLPPPRERPAAASTGPELADLDDDEIAAIEAAAAELDGADAPEGASFSYVEAEAGGNDAVMSLMQAGQRDAWVERATWLYDEAPDGGQPTERARALLVVAELLAMAGEEERAETVAREALQLAPSLPMAHRQLRGILMARGKWTEVADALDAEGRVAPTNAAKLHASYLGGEVARLIQGDPQGASHRLDTAERVAGNDVRVPLARLMQSLAAADEVPATQGSGSAALEASLQPLRALRSDGAAGDAGQTAYAAVLHARANLRKRDVGAAVEALHALEQVEEFGAGASWLISALAAPHANLRAEAVKALGRVSDGSHGAVATRARAARALELGDANVVTQLANGAADDVLSATERLILASLAGATLDEADSWLEQAADAEPALAAAAAAVLDASPVEVGEAGALSAVLLGRALAAATAAEATSSDPSETGTASQEGESQEAESEEAESQEAESQEAESQEAESEEAASADDEIAIDGVVEPSAPPASATTLPDALVNAAKQLAETQPSDGIARAVLLEHAYASGDIGRLAAALGDESAEGYEVERSLAAALLAELAGDYEHMENELERVIAAQPDNEAAMRMAMVIADPAVGASALARYANSVEDPARAGIALTEAGLRLMEEEGQEADGETLLRSAADKAPDFPVASFIGLYVAQALGDPDGEEFWFEMRRRAAVEPADAAMDSVRQAVRIGADGLAERASLLEEAHRARPDDYCLRELYEQSAGVSEDRAAWLMERAGDDAEASMAPLALEAALASELDGDLELAARCARRAVELGDTRLAPIFQTRYALRGHGSGEVLEKLRGDARAATEPTQRAERLELVAQIEARGRGDWDKAAEALRAVVAEQPQNLGALHALEAMAFHNGDVTALEDVCMAIAGSVEGSVRAAHAMMAARLTHANKGWEQTFDAVRLAFETEPPSLWSMRQMAAHLRARGDHAAAAGIDCTLAERTDAPLDRATLLLRGAEGSLAAGDIPAAADLLGEVVELWPRHPIALLERAALHVRNDETEAAARAFEELGMVCQSPHERCAKLYRAASLWLSIETAEGQDEGRRLLEAVSTIDASYEDTFERLQAIYLAAGAKRELADLLAARLDNVTDPDERVQIEVMRGRMLVEAGSAGEARHALEAALEANPDNPEALSAFADVCAAEGEWEQVEQSIIRLGRLVSDPEKQCEIYLRLGALYDEHLPNPERAEMAYQEVLKRAPDNVTARAKLVDLYLAKGEAQKAFDQQQEVINAAKSPSDKCVATVKLAEIHEASGDAKQAEQSLVKARRTWSKEPAPVTALYAFYKRTGQDPAADILLERAAADVRRGLGAGRFEAPLFAMAETVAELRGQSDAAQIAKATLGAITGEAAYIEGGGLSAGQPELDDHTAPEVLTSSFRQLLSATGDVMDEAAPFDLKSLRAKPLPPPNADVIERTREIAAAYGLPSINVVATNALGRVCVPAQSEPPTLCFGLPLVTADRADIRDFLIHRALKVLQTRTAALSRTAPIDLWPLVAAYLQLHSPSFKPQGVDAGKVATFKAKMEKVMPPPDPQLSLLASEVIGSIGNRASSLNTITNSWGSRTGLLAMGDPNLALEAIAWAAGTAQGPPPSGTERVRWIGRQAEARDLIVFSVSDGYAAARTALGIDSAMAESVEFVEIDDEL